MTTDVVYLCNGMLPSHLKNAITTFATTGMDLEIILLNEVSRKIKTNVQVMKNKTEDSKISTV